VTSSLLRRGFPADNIIMTAYAQRMTAKCQLRLNSKTTSDQEAAIAASAASVACNDELLAVYKASTDATKKPPRKGRLD